MKNSIYITFALILMSISCLMAQDISLTNANLTKPSQGDEYGQACFTLIAEEGVSVTSIPAVIEISMSKVQFDASNIFGFNSDHFTWTVDAFAGNVIRGTLNNHIQNVDNGGGGAQICIPVKRATVGQYDDSRNGFVVNIVPGSLDQGGNSGSDYTSRFGFSNSSFTAYSDKTELVKRNDQTRDMLNANVSVYPNPSSDVMRITMALDGEDYSISVFDISGRSMVQNLPFNGDKAIDVQNWTPGMYIMEVQNKANGYTSIKRVMVAE